MKLEEAIRIGKELGLKSPEECVNNILIHCLNLFYYPDIPKEINELIQDAKEHGIEFCPICGAAMINGECYMRDLTHKKEGEEK